MTKYNTVNSENLTHNLLRPITFGKVYGAYYPSNSGVKPEQICVNLLKERFFYYYKVETFHDLTIEALEKLKEAISNIKLIDCIYIEVSPSFKGEALGHGIDILRNFNMIYLEHTIIIGIGLSKFDLEVFDTCQTYETKFLDGCLYTDDNKEYKVYKERYGELSKEN